MNILIIIATNPPIPGMAPTNVIADVIRTNLFGFCDSGSNILQMTAMARQINPNPIEMPVSNKQSAAIFPISSSIRPPCRNYKVLKEHLP